MAKISINNIGVVVKALPGQSVLVSLLNEDQPIHTVCGGKAICSCCRIRILSENKGISPINEREKVRLKQENLESGWRLACQTYILRDVSIYLPQKDELPSHCSKKK